MAYAFEKLSQLVNQLEGLPENGEYRKRRVAITDRVWHHSLTKKLLSGSTAFGFADYHVRTLGWPGCGYALVIEPKNIIQTINDPRARIVYVHPVDRRTFHVGDSNEFSLGICVAGDYRYDELDDATKASIDELQEALVTDGIGDTDKSHQEVPGYSWKPCCVFNYMETFNFLDGRVTQSALPETYTIQEGDTFWSIAKGDDRFTVEDLVKANPGIDYNKLKVGQQINLAAAEKKKDPKSVEKVEVPKTAVKTNTVVSTSIVDYLNSKGINSSYTNREKLAKEFGVSPYSGTAAQNKELLDKIKIGKKVTTSTSTKEGNKVTLSKSATTFATGESILDRVKGKTYTVLQVKPDRVLLKEIMSWVWKKDVGGSAAAAPKTYKEGQTAKIKSCASRYATGQSIPASVKNKKYTIQQVKSDRVLLKEIVSWVFKSDIS